MNTISESAKDRIIREAKRELGRDKGIVRTEEEIDRYFLEIKRALADFQYDKPDEIIAEIRKEVMRI